jgi:hypothetical protein
VKCWWKQHVPLKSWYPTTTLHAVTTYKASTWRWRQLGPLKGWYSTKALRGVTTQTTIIGSWISLSYRYFTYQYNTLYASLSLAFRPIHLSPVSVVVYMELSHKYMVRIAHLHITILRKCSGFLSRVSMTICMSKYFMSNMLSSPSVAIIKILLQQVKVSDILNKKNHIMYLSLSLTSSSLHQRLLMFTNLRLKHKEQFLVLGSQFPLQVFTSPQFSC